MAENYLIEMEEIEKSFPGVHALSNCRFNLKSGEVHALVGENGAGKSTLVKIMSGVYKKDSGTIKMNGKEVDMNTPKQALNHGISIIHQELQLAPHLTIAENITLGREPRNAKAFLDKKAEIAKSQKLIDSMNVKLDVNKKVGELSVAGQYMVEIARAISRNAKILIMDEPTAALTNAEIDDLFKLIHEMRESGMGIVYISHRMEELKRIADRVTVMRDGCYIDTKDIDEVTLDDVVRMMVGRTIYESSPVLPENPSEEVVLEVKNLNRGTRIKNVSFQLHKGEILGLSGLIGAGRTEVARAIFGADKIDSGEIYIKGKKVNVTTPKVAVQHGIGYLSEDRKELGLTVAQDIETNIAIPSYNKFSRHGLVKDAMIASAAGEAIEKLNVVTPSSKQVVKNLSGGNQQKVVIAKWLVRDSDILIFDEPTRGIDVGAKNEIYKLLNELAAQGKSIIMISSELPEILRMSHRILVMCEGSLTGELSAEEATQEKIMKLAMQRVIG